MCRVPTRGLDVRALLAQAAEMPGGLNSTIGAAVLSRPSDLLHLSSLPLEWQLLLIDYEMQQVALSREYRPIALTAFDFAWERLLDACSQCESAEVRVRLLSAIVLFANSNAQTRALSQLESIGCESILHFAHAFKGLPGAEALLTLGQSIIRGTLVRIPSGAFVYGNTPKAQAEELRRVYPVIGDDSFDMTYWLRGEFGQHELYTSAYFISLHPITNRMFKKFRLDHLFSSSLADHPVVGIDFHVAASYAKWCCCDLPSEVEWEKAMRGTDGRSYAWGNAPDLSRCNVLQSGFGTTTPVGHFENYSPFGCLDGNGNVWEWTRSDFENRSWRKAIRGGSWTCTIELARCATRCWTAPSDRSVALGFRVMRKDI